MTIETPASWKVLPKSLAESEVSEMLDRGWGRQRTLPATADKSPLGLRPWPIRDHAILELLYAGGLRVGEIVALGEEDLHLDQARAQVRGKGDRGAHRPVGAQSRRGAR